MPIAHFQDDDDAYLRWMDAHEPDGWVINRERTATTGWRLHRAACWHLRHQVGANVRWTHHYVKDCATAEAPLVAFARQRGAELVRCPRCLPD
ncbi:MAG: hypothetical protein R3F59_25680 [Myxococcota bacterium]